MNMLTYDAQWIEGNNAGNGYSIGEESDGINNLHIGELLVRSSSSDRVAVYRLPLTRRLVAVGDAGGPWAVDVEPMWYDED